MVNRAMKTLLALALLTSAASAEVLLPPTRYDQPAQAITIQELPRKQVHKACKAYFGWLAQGMRNIEACADPVARIIILPARGSVSERKWECLYRHEIGHINGWDSDHRGGLSLSECN
jgi:hypothetical protein